MNKEQFEKQHPGLKSEMMMEEAISSMELSKDKYNQLREEIIKAVPEIRKKEIGCKIYKPNYWENTKDKNLYGVIVGTNKTMDKLEADDIVYVRYYCEGSYIHLYNIYDFSEKHPEGIKIIGRPITLEDCLIAIKKKELKNEDGNREFVMINDNGMIQSELYNWEEEPVFWRMGKSLHQQEQETIDFLWDLICKK